MSNSKLDLSRFGLSLTTIFLVIWVVGFIYGKTQLFEWWWFIIIFILELVITIPIMILVMKMAMK